MTGGGAIDAHLHLWNPHRGYGWLEAADSALNRRFDAADAFPELEASGIDGAVLVQADDTIADTEAMLSAAAAAPWVLAVVGWARLEDDEAAARHLERWAGEPLVAGLRHLTHEDPRDGFLALPAVRRSLRTAASLGLAFDIPDAWPRHLAAAAELAGAIPELTVVVDHLGKPPRGTDQMAQWRSGLAAVAARGNTVAKLSGLARPGQPFTVEALRPVWETALALFGPDRLMYGGDWPMTLPNVGYPATWRVLRCLIDELSPHEQQQVLAGTAARAYHINTPPRPGKGDRPC